MMSPRAVTPALAEALPLQPGTGDWVEMLARCYAQRRFDTGECTVTDLQAFEYRWRTVGRHWSAIADRGETLYADACTAIGVDPVPPGTPPGDLPRILPA